MRYSVLLAIEVEAEDAEKAFALVRTNYCVIDDPDEEVTTAGNHTKIDFDIDGVVEIENELPEDEQA